MAVLRRSIRSSEHDARLARALVCTLGNGEVLCSIHSGGTIKPLKLLIFGLQARCPPRLDATNLPGMRQKHWAKSGQSISQIVATYYENGGVIFQRSTYVGRVVGKAKASAPIRALSRFKLERIVRLTERVEGTTRLRSIGPRGHLVPPVLRTERSLIQSKDPLDTFVPCAVLESLFVRAGRSMTRRILDLGPGIPVRRSWR